MPKLDLKALVAVRPAGSHAVIALLAILCGVCLLAGFAFWWEKPDRAWLPFSCAAAFLVLIVAMWFLSRRDVDSASLQPTRVVSADGGRTTEIVTDSRNLRDPEVIAAIEGILSIVRHRGSLPLPDALIDEAGHPIPRSVSDANEGANAIDEQVREIERSFEGGRPSGPPGPAEGG